MDKEKLTCPICGEKTRVYMGNARRDRLCGKHADMLKAGDIYIDSHNRYRDKTTNDILKFDQQLQKEDEVVKGNEVKSEEYEENKIEPDATKEEQERKNAFSVTKRVETICFASHVFQNITEKRFYSK